MRLPKLLFLFPFLLTGCVNSNNTYLQKPEDTNLDYWITQYVSSQTMSEDGCTFLPGWFGASEFLDKRYEVVEEDGRVVVPDVHVTYLLSGYPDVLDSYAVTRIQITDPEIYVYGLTINSSVEEIANRMKTVPGAKGSGRAYKIKKASFGFNEGNIYISVPSTNKNKVVF